MRSQFTQGKIAVIQIHQLYAYKTGLKGHNLNVSKRRNLDVYHVTQRMYQSDERSVIHGLYEPRLQWKE